MQTYIKRKIHDQIQKYLDFFPVVAILGPRQCGKSTIAKEIIKKYKKYIFLDLERNSDLSKLTEPELFLAAKSDNLICLDEIQRLPELFSVLRYEIDTNNRNGQFLILGSASRDLLRQSTETLAGRICYLELTPFIYPELNGKVENLLINLWVKGGFPKSILTTEVEQSLLWRENFIKTFLERDIKLTGFNVSSTTMYRLWTMLAHSHGQTVNYSKFASSLGVTSPTVKQYIDILSETYMVRILPPYEANIKKRLIKSPKVYIRDSGILHSLLDIENYDNLLGHPIFGASWEGYCIENILSSISNKWKAFFYRTSSGKELDLILQRGLKKVALEFKASKAPAVTKGFWSALEDLQIKNAYVVAPINEKYPLGTNVFAVNLETIIEELNNS